MSENNFINSIDEYGDNEVIIKLMSNSLSCYNDNYFITFQTGYIAESSIHGINFPNVIFLNGSTINNCPQLTTLDFPNCVNIYSQGHLSITACPKLTFVNFPKMNNGLTIQTCNALQTINLPSYNVVQRENLIASCPNLTSISLPNLTNWWGCIVKNCPSIQYISLPNVETRFWGGDYAGPFADCANLKTVVFSKLKIIGNDYAKNITSPRVNFDFRNCENIVSLESRGAPSASIVEKVKIIVADNFYNGYLNDPTWASNLPGVNLANIFIKASDFENE